MTDVLISASELADLLKTEPCVVIDTRNPDAYGAGHLPNAVNVHEIFTFLATSTPEGISELKTKFADAFGAAGLSGKRQACGHMLFWVRLDCPGHCLGRWGAPPSHRRRRHDGRIRPSGNDV